MATEAHLLTKSVLEHRKSIASKTKSWPSVSGHDFERRKTFAVEMDALARNANIVTLHRDPAKRSRCRSEETPRLAKKPRRKAGIRAVRGVSELVPVAGLEPARLLRRGILRLVSHTEDSGSTRNYRFKTY